MPGENDDLLNPDEIEALLNSAGAGTSPAAGGSAELLKHRDGGQMPGTTPKPSPASAAERLLNQAEADLAAAVAPEMSSPRGIPPELGTPAAFGFQEFGNRPAEEGTQTRLSALEDVELDLHIELGRTELLIEEVVKLEEGSVVPLDKLAGDPVDILVNGRLIARGEVLVLNDNFCVRVAEILTPDY